MMVQFFMALAASVSFAVLYNAPKEELLFSGLSGAAGWVVYLIVSEQTGDGGVFAYVIATIALTLLSRILAVIRRYPVTVYLTVSIFPLVPGIGIYYTVYYLINKQNELFAARGLATFEAAAGIAFGIAAAFAIPQKWFTMFECRKKEDYQESERGQR